MAELDAAFKAKDETAIELAKVPNRSLISITSGYWYEESFTGRDGERRYVIKGRVSSFEVVTLATERDANATEPAAEAQPAQPAETQAATASEDSISF